MLYAEVCVNTPLGQRPLPQPAAEAEDVLGRTFTYAVPDRLIDRLEPGHLAWVPFRGPQTSGGCRRAARCRPGVCGARDPLPGLGSAGAYPRAVSTRHVGQPDLPGALDRVAPPHASRRPFAAWTYRLCAHACAHAVRTYPDAKCASGAHRRGRRGLGGGQRRAGQGNPARRSRTADCARPGGTRVQLPCATAPQDRPAGAPAGRRRRRGACAAHLGARLEAG